VSDEAHSVYLLFLVTEKMERGGIMNTLAERYQDQISGVISCFDRVIISGLLSAANRRYSSFLAALDQPDIDLGKVKKIAHPVRQNNRSYRGFNLFYGIDLSLFLSIVRGQFCIKRR
jgi:hypothetical protein